MNAPWAEGYVAELDYPSTYLADLNPLRMQLPFLVAGLQPPQVRTACELGFGQGLSVNVHAVASQVQWHGTDFLPDQALRARDLADAGGAGAVLEDQSFAEYCARDDLPDFDFIALHGVWSWISDANRALLVGFIRRKLRLGGVVYFGYNTQPGWATMAPLRDLAMLHVQRMGGAGQGLAGRIEGAVEFLGQLLATGPAFAKMHPGVAQLVATLKSHDAHYLAHEYFNSDWRPMAFAEMAAALEPAKLRYACSAHHDVASTHLTPEQQAMLQGLPDPVVRESVHDFCMNQRFRKDYWVKGARPLTAAEQARGLRDLRLALVTPRAQVRTVLNTLRGELRIDNPLFTGLLDALADHRPRSIGALEQALAGTGVQLAQLVEAVQLCVSAGDIALALPEATVVAVKPQADRFNLHLLTQALVRDDFSHLACPATGGGVLVNRIEQLLLYAALDPARKPEDMPALLWQVLKPQGVRMLSQQQPLESDAENLAELGQLARNFVQARLPMLRALGVVPSVSKA